MTEKDKTDLLLESIVVKNLDKELVAYYKKQAREEIIAEGTIGNIVKCNMIAFINTPSRVSNTTLVSDFLVNGKLFRIEKEIDMRRSDLARFDFNIKTTAEEILTVLGKSLASELINSNEEVKQNILKMLKP